MKSIITNMFSCILKSSMTLNKKTIYFIMCDSVRKKRKEKEKEKEKESHMIYDGPTMIVIFVERT